MLTFFKSVDSAAKGQLISADDPDKDSQQTAGNPPPDRITQEINLLSGVIFGPEADTSE